MTTLSLTIYLRGGTQPIIVTGLSAKDVAGFKNQMLSDDGDWGALGPAEMFVLVRCDDVVAIVMVEEGDE